MFRRPRPDRPPAHPSIPLCELRVSAFTALSSETTPTRHCSPIVQTRSTYGSLFSVTSKRLIQQPISFHALTNAYRCFPKQRRIHPRPCLGANILFRITSFADTRVIIPIESYPYGIRGGEELPLLFSRSEIAPQHPSVTLGRSFWELRAKRTTRIQGVTRV
jgi:hypothetical protein